MRTDDDDVSALNVKLYGYWLTQEKFWQSL